MTLNICGAFVVQFNGMLKLPIFTLYRNDIHVIKKINKKLYMEYTQKSEENGKNEKVLH